MHVALVQARATAAACLSSHPHAMEYRHPYSSGSASASANYGDASPAADFRPAAFGAGRPAVRPAPLDVFDYLSDGGAHPAPAAVPAVPTFGSPPPPPPRSMPAVQVVPDAAGYGHAARGAASVAAAAEEPTTMTDRIAFRMRSDKEVLDDGYRWRKYGKKAVKNSPNPRNYYRCSTEGCNVKKRVEKDRDDPSYVVTIYEGVHNHASPGTVYYATQDAASGRFFVSGTHHPGH